MLSQNLYFSGQRSKSVLIDRKERPWTLRNTITGHRASLGSRWRTPAGNPLQACRHHGPPRQQPPDAMRPRSGDGLAAAIAVFRTTTSGVAAESLAGPAALSRYATAARHPPRPRQQIARASDRGRV